MLEKQKIKIWANNNDKMAYLNSLPTHWHSHTHTSFENIKRWGKKNFYNFTTNLNKVKVKERERYRENREIDRERERGGERWYNGAILKILWNL